MTYVNNCLQLLTHKWLPRKQSIILPSVFSLSCYFDNRNVNSVSVNQCGVSTVDHFLSDVTRSCSVLYCAAVFVLFIFSINLIIFSVSCQLKKCPIEVSLICCFAGSCLRAFDGCVWLLSSWAWGSRFGQARSPDIAQLVLLTTLASSR